MNELDLILKQPEIKNENIRLGRSAYFFPFKRFFLKNELRLFALNLSRLLEGGIPLLRALELIGKQARDKDFRDALGGIREDIKQGLSFSEALQKRADIFPPFFVQAVQAGELSGSLDKILNLLFRHLQRIQDSQRKMLAAAVYPAFLLALGLVTMGILLHFVVPRISQIYQELGSDLPWITRMILFLSHSFFPFLLILAAAAALLITRALALKENFFRFLIRIPFASGILKNGCIQQLFSLLYLLLQGGIPILQALAAAAPVSAGFVQKDFEGVRESLKQGIPFSDALRKIDWLDETALALIRSGEESGKLPEAIWQVAEEARSNGEAKSELMIKFLEPLLILILGAAVGFIAVAVLLPILEMNVWIQ